MFARDFGWLNSIPIVGDSRESSCRPGQRSSKIPPLKTTLSLAALGPKSATTQTFTLPTEVPGKQHCCYTRDLHHSYSSFIFSAC